MKYIVMLMLITSIWMMVKETEETVERQHEEEITVSWLRDRQDGTKNSALEKGSFFVAQRNTVYGADCKGCTIENDISSTSSRIMVSVNAVRQSDGSWKQGVTYDGYYLIAADKALPMCTVVRISRHTYSGSGIVVNEPFYALVVDRGSMIQENTIDLFAGSEKYPQIVHESLGGAIVEIVDYLNYQENEFGQMTCAGK